MCNNQAASCYAKLWMIYDSNVVTHTNLVRFVNNIWEKCHLSALVILDLCSVAHEKCKANL